MIDLLKQLDDEAQEDILSSVQTCSQDRLRAEVEAFKDGISIFVSGLFLLF